jgi:hypothetical protein
MEVCWIYQVQLQKGIRYANSDTIRKESNPLRKFA